jgi:hypothetical protein
MGIDDFMQNIGFVDGAVVEDEDAFILRVRVHLWQLPEDP